MAKWYEAANEASFKAVAEGYVFQSPNPWILARPRYYLVSAAQKAEISERLRRWRIVLVTFTLITCVLMGSSVAFVTLSPATFVGMLRPVIHLGMGFIVLMLSLLMAVAVIPMVAVPHIYLMRALRPLLANAPRTNERITVAEQLPRIAASSSGKILAMGLFGGGLMAAGGILMLVDAFREGHLARSLTFSVPVLVFGGLVIAYFVYLARLKARLQRSAA